jgi:hypothetical protein
MASRYEIELSAPRSSRCDCCDGLSVRLTRFVHRDGDAFAVYFASYSNNHPETELAMLIVLGEWGDESDASQRAGFYCRVRPSGESYEVMLGDAADSPWKDADLVGQKLSRAEAIRHPWKATAFEVLDEAFEQDPSLHGFMERAWCGDVAVPLETRFQAPDAIFELARDDARAKLGPSFASLDDERFFLRGVLAVPVEGYESWSVGVWVEVSKRDHDRAYAAWDEPARYLELRFAGVLANDVGERLGLPIPPGTEVRVRVPDADAAPQVEAAGPGPLADLLARPWEQQAFEEYAVARGYL